MTKFAIAIALTATIAGASSALANSYFTLDANQDSGSTLDLGIVVSEVPGTVEIYDFRLGVQGKLLGTEDVHAGANRDTRVDLGSEPFGDVIAVLKSDSGQILATTDVDIRDN
ncbi:hypothetical protein [Aestuariibius sp. HNIBRBA575]|uniref:hypothetical protein n=1 Tax=Aestuariibius sp. HNIBRBA575 TaxID=3233343 RepID=UPI0034A19809